MSNYNLTPNEPPRTQPISLLAADDNQLTNTIRTTTVSENTQQRIVSSSQQEQLQKDNDKIEIEDETQQTDLENNPWLVQFPITDHKNRADNYIRTTKYTLFTFLPLNFYYQFRRFYNLYFLAGALSVASGQSSLSPFSQIFPLIVVFFFAAAKEAIEDYARYKADKEANNIPHKCIRNGQQHKILCMDFKPGDIFYIEKGESIPVDAMLISSSYEDGTCFIETANLDGETNLKRRSTLNELNHLNTVEQVSKLVGHVECEHPNENLNNFTGRVVIEKASSILPPNVKSGPDDRKVLSLNMSNILLRGCVLRNTDHAFGLVVYAGRNTKIIRNLKQAKQKTSTLEKRLNYFTLGAFVYNAFLLISSIIFEYIQYNNVVNEEQKLKSQGLRDYSVQWYLGPVDPDRAKHILFSVFSFFALYTYVIPISLFVTMEVTRLIQGRFMIWDKKMRLYKSQPDGTTKTIKMRANNTNLNEELGNVDYVFSDKTGTLTQNDMRASNWFVAGKVYDEMHEPGVLKTALKHASGQDAIDLTLFTRALGLCHSVVPALDEKTNELMYESQSPDETALLEAMRTNGMKLLSRNKSQIIVENSQPSSSSLSTITSSEPIVETYQQLAVLEFSSDRKRMSVVVQCPNADIHLYCKGADNMIVERLDRQHPLNDKEILKRVKQALHDFSVIGLRTLCVAWKQISQEQWRQFRAQLDEAEQSLINREERIAAVSEKIEQGLIFAGCTAIEDRLQDEVPETIDYLLKMGIKVWLLTGDKQETAINIGMSTKLISSSMNLVIVTGDSIAEVSTNIERSIEKLEREHSGLNALVISGHALSYALLDEVKSQFLKLCVLCHSVICCRVTPLQKALVVKLVKTELKIVALAIGDGANDVSMIQAADIGVGIQGREGAQAVRAADYAFGEFRFLKRLLSVHGRYSYHRLTQLIFYSFYKNITLITVQWWFGFVSGWSGQGAYEEIFLTVFNVIFTSLPPFFIALFDKDVNEEEIERYPQLYKEVKKGLYWNFKVIFGWFLSTYWHSLLLFGAVYFIHHTGVLDYDGSSTGYWIQCYFFGTPLLMIVMLKASLVTRSWVWLNAFAIILSLLLNVVIMYLVELFGFLEVGTPEINHILPAYYLTILFLTFGACIPDYFVMAWKRIYYPSDADVMLEESKVRKSRRISSSDTIPMTQIDASPRIN